MSARVRCKKGWGGVTLWMLWLAIPIAWGEGTRPFRCPTYKGHARRRGVDNQGSRPLCPRCKNGAALHCTTTTSPGWAINGRTGPVPLKVCSMHPRLSHPHTRLPIHPPTPPPHHTHMHTLSRKQIRTQDAHSHEPKRPEEAHGGGDER